MMFRVHKTILRSLYLILAATMLLVVSCVEKLYDDSYMYREGVETNISLKISVPEMTIATRADMPDGADTQLNSLWVGIFSATTGELKYARFLTSQELGQTQKAEHGNFYKLPDITVKSGSSYIVAVGNPVDNMGYQYNSNSAEPISSKDLAEILPVDNNAAFSWETFKNIAISRLALGNVIDDPMNMVMSGVYYANKGNHGNNGNEDPGPIGWEEANYTPVEIPAIANGIYEMEGAIHLRRLISQVKFNIKASNYNGDNANKSNKRIVKVIPQSYKVVNAPFTSWLHERVMSADGTNSGDVIKVAGITYGTESLPLKSNYRTSATFMGNQNISGDDTNGYSFDFWMLENKRKALSNGPISYDDREKEQKTSFTDVNGDKYNLNTGIYTALCGDGQETMNNCATFVEIRCKIEYTEDGLGALKEEQNYNDVLLRTAEAVYTIHLGGVKKNQNQDYDWNDFSHRRNHKYTYNITVVDIDRIIVEANGEEEQRPGIEGVVTDILQPAFNLDAHYGVFNICLTNKERTGGSGQDKYKNGFPFRIQVYDRNNNPIVIDQDNYIEYNEVAESPEQNSLRKPKYYWTWIEFRPTSGRDVLAEYKPYYKKDDDGNDTKERFVDANGTMTFRLNEIADLDKYPGYNDTQKNPDDNTERWYTVFVNEYTYEDFTDEKANNWVKYANKLDRICWLNTQGGVSSDKESVHIKSKYFITQKSIQTFYDIPNIDSNNPDIDAIGLEHTNEVYGLTVRWAYSSNNNAAWKVPDDDRVLTNGKWTQREYIRWKDNPTNQTETVDWSKYIKPTTLQEITSINKNSLQYVLPDHAGLVEGQIYYVPRINTYYYRRGDAFSAHNPNTQYAVTAMEACMNRNRDNNGNGKIDRSEIRWYLPSSGEMIDLVNGRNSLENPLMDYESNPQLNTPEKLPGDYSKHHGNLRFHYATSNQRLLWAEEGITINHTTDAENEWNKMGWQIRCARALGTNLRDDDMTLTPAFEVNDAQNPTMIYPTYFESRTLREPTNEVLDPHQETSRQNRISVTGFEFSKELYDNVTYRYDGRNGIDPLLKNPQTHDDIIKQGNAFCKTLDTAGKTGWRMPNIKECAVLKLALNNAGINYIGNPGNNGRSLNNGYRIGNYFACTYREYGVNDESRDDHTGYYLGILYENQNSNPQGHLGRAQCLTEYDPTYYIRCVRDLRPGEFPGK